MSFKSKVEMFKNALAGNNELQAAEAIDIKFGVEPIIDPQSSGIDASVSYRRKYLLGEWGNEREDYRREYERRAKEEYFMREQQARMNQQLDQIALSNSPTYIMGSAGMTSGASISIGSQQGSQTAAGASAMMSQAQSQQNARWQKIQNQQWSNQYQQQPIRSESEVQMLERALCGQQDEIRCLRSTLAEVYKLVNAQTVQIKTIQAQIDKMSLTPSAKSVEDISSQMENYIC